MRYLGLDVHSKATVWHLLAADGRTVGRGQVTTTVDDLTALVSRLGKEEELLAGQEIGSSSYFVYDVMQAAGVRLLSFNAQHLRMIASSRKKTDKRDAHWIAKALQTGMTPNPVYLPSGHVRRLRHLLSQRDALLRDQKRWLLRAKSLVRAAGIPVPNSKKMSTLCSALITGEDGLDQPLAVALERCSRMHENLTLELKAVDAELQTATNDIDAIRRLQTIPAVGPLVAATIYAWVGDISRFASARQLTSYAGLVPSVWQSGAETRMGGITSQGSPTLRSMLIQAGHVLLGRCRSESSSPLRALAARVQASSKRRKIAVVAAARHILRIAYYVLRDGTEYDPARLPSTNLEAAAE